MLNSKKSEIQLKFFLGQMLYKYTAVPYISGILRTFGHAVEGWHSHMKWKESLSETNMGVAPPLFDP